MNSTKMIAAACLLICLSVICIGVVDGGNCKYIPHCDDCKYDPDTKKATCFRCDKLFGLTQEYGFSKCKNCSDNEGCLLCKNFQKCDLCRFSYRDGPDMDGRATCSACAPNCRSCKESGAGKCDVCAAGSRKVGDRCQLCNAENCAYCDSTFQTCTSCKNGYFLEDNKCTLCQDNCKLCESKTRCRMCNDKFFRDDNGQCMPCIANCRTCNDFGRCNECSMGFFLDVFNQCSACDDSCLVCTSKDVCTYCRQGKPVDGSCKCAPNCESCQKVGYTKCDSCERGYTQSEGKGCKKVRD